MLTTPMLIICLICIALPVPVGIILGIIEEIKKAKKEDSEDE